MSQTIFDEMPASSSSTLEDVRCYNFSVGSPHRMEFYSPGYPGAYPARVDCFLVLTGNSFDGTAFFDGLGLTHS